MCCLLARSGVRAGQAGSDEVQPHAGRRMPDGPARAEARGGPSRRGQWWARQLYVQLWGGVDDPKTIVSL